jgi:hypothetical protein
LNTGRTGKKFAADGLADYLEEPSEIESSFPFQAGGRRVFAQRAFYPNDNMPFSSGERGF